MKKPRFTETQIVKAIEEHENGRYAKDICRELEIITAAFYKWCQHYGDLNISKLRRVKKLEEVNRRLKRLAIKAVWTYSMQQKMPVWK
jgi:putative transposase